MKPLQPLRIVGRYLLFERIAAGGMATVHLARLLGPQGFSRTVCIKQLHPQFAQDPEFVQMFLNEARLASRIRHPNVLSPSDVLAANSELFIVMDYVHGVSLSRLLRAAAAPVPPRIVAALAVQLLSGLQSAHDATGEQGEALHIVHRDVSPQNILVGADGHLRIIDFGIAKAMAVSHTTRGGEVKGKVGYMAPEQLKQETCDGRSDLFSAGIVLWEMLTGRRLFAADSPAASVERVLRERIPAPSEIAPGPAAVLDAIVLRALNRERAQRFQSCAELARAIDLAVTPAGALELGAWVSGLVGAELAGMAEQVATAEGLSLDELTLPVAREAESELMIEELPASSSQQSLRFAVSSSALSVNPHKRWLPRLALAAVLFAGTVGSSYWLLKPHRQAVAALVNASSTAAPAPAETSESVPTSVRPAPREASSSTPFVVPVGGVHAEPAPIERAPIATASRPPGLSRSSSKASGARAATPGAGSARIRASEPLPTQRKQTAVESACAVPYWIDGQGVKRFKPECF